MTLSFYGVVPITGSVVQARASIRDAAVESLYASARDAPAKAGEVLLMFPNLEWIQPPPPHTHTLVTEPYRRIYWHGVKRPRTPSLGKLNCTADMHT